jgi:WD repeat-containing protein 11
METCSFGTAERCLITARLFGDESELVFWTVAQHYIRASAAGGIGKTPSGDGLTILGRGAENLLILDEGSTETTNDDQSLLPTIRNKLLGTCHDIVRDNRTFGEYERRRAALHDARRAPGEPTRRCAEDLILLGDADRAVQLLLETDPTDADKFYVDSLRACLVASVRSSGASQSTIKLVATNLIACGRLSEGVQLLCLIDKGADACRYLQTYGQWREAARLAKATLGETECADVMRRWADHLASPAVDRRSSATLVLLSLGRFTAVVDLLVSVRHFDRAALFIEACQEFGLLQECPSAEVVFSGYARFLYGLGLNRLFEYYCNKAGEKGKVLLAELQQN